MIYDGLIYDYTVSSGDAANQLRRDAVAAIEEADIGAEVDWQDSELITVSDLRVLIESDL